MSQKDCPNSPASPEASLSLSLQLLLALSISNLSCFDGSGGVVLRRKDAPFFSNLSICVSSKLVHGVSCSSSYKTLGNRSSLSVISFPWNLPKRKWIPRVRKFSSSSSFSCYCHFHRSTPVATAHHHHHLTRALVLPPHTI